MAPELIKQERCSEKIDVYSFGVVIWEMLTRETPFANVDHRSIYYRVATNTISLPIPKEAPSCLQLLIEKCMSKNGRNRPSFSHIRQFYQSFAKPELLMMSEEEWQTKWALFHEFAQSIQYCTRIKIKTAMEVKQLAQIKQIRQMYETKLKRTNKMCKKLQDCFRELKKKENEFAERENDLTQRESRQTSLQCNVSRVTRGNCYPKEGDEICSSDEEARVVPRNVRFHPSRDAPQPLEYSVRVKSSSIKAGLNQPEPVSSRTSMDSRRSSAEDADAESSSSTEDDEGNGSSVSNTPFDASSSDDEDDQHPGYQGDTLHSLTSYLQSLKLAAARSDDELSDNEKNVKDVLRIIKKPRSKCN
uniref:Protein kinase domain-containing protein n=1 Tax=Caenorhabditis japonica TaxID=281687 RepID=A0A8R1DGH5_CAEJA